MTTKVTLPYDPAWKAVDWAKKNCPSYITNDVHRQSNGNLDLSRIDYYFSEESDTVIFMLKWG